MAGPFCHPPLPLIIFFNFFFLPVIPYQAGNVFKKLRRSEFIVYAVVYTCTDPGNLTFRNFFPLFLQIFCWVLIAPPPAPFNLFFNFFFCSVIPLTDTPRELLDLDESAVEGGDQHQHPQAGGVLRKAVEGQDGGL